MSDYVFLFDLDSTITKQEILPTISSKIGMQQEMQELTEATMRGEIPFRASFLRRVKILSDLNVSEINKLVEGIALNTELVRFIRQNRDRCYVVTGNLDVWISGLMRKIGIEEHLYCSKAAVYADKITKVTSVIDKELAAKQFIQPLVVIGDGDNDAGMAEYASIAIGFGAVRSIAPSLLRKIDYAFYEDKRCAAFLESLL